MATPGALSSERPSSAPARRGRGARRAWLGLASAGLCIAPFAAAQAAAQASGGLVPLARP
jgi:hypothetical protein